LIGRAKRQLASHDPIVDLEEQRVIGQGSQVGEPDGDRPAGLVPVHPLQVGRQLPLALG
jgi:hypothetical protein